MRNCIAIIPARGGSKRIKNKNIKSFCGKPIISFPIRAALDSGCFDKVIVSTENKKISKIALKYGAEVLFKRPKRLSGNSIPTKDVINHSITLLKKKKIKFDYVCCIYPTSPLITKKRLRKGYRLIKKNRYNFVFTILEFPYPIQRSFRIKKRNTLQMLYPKFYKLPSNNFEKIYHDAGQFYFGKTEAFLKNKKTFGKNSLPIILNKTEAIDINDTEDWKIAESLYSK